ncbi:hypothetical protein PRK78_006581 [Emydomyces testavorans]|uniref:Uncharacterized protein n=1 Tax=Emydomyces testavorans TaxID=2070801 RepID=A0AAF0ILU2_9EURO|nr:hypothetical protein PRK78_006581 [Emydomyces testavorans]
MYFDNLSSTSSTVNNVPASVQDQIADHDSNAVKYYLDEVVRTDVKAIVMKLPSRAVVQDVAHSLELDTDLATPYQSTHEQLQQIANHPEVRSLSELNIKLTARIRAAGYNSLAAATGTPLYARKIKIQAQLNSAKKFLQNHYQVKNQR